MSNASDAIQKRKYLGLTEPALLNPLDDSIILRFDTKKKILEIHDSGIGLNDAELSETLGTLAKSGTASFLDQLEKAKGDNAAASNLIGKFGVGFYSAFMVADSVEVLTRKAGTTDVFLWTSDGQT
jgi:molecular chaperone HtpG